MFNRKIYISIFLLIGFLCFMVIPGMAEEKRYYDWPMLGRTPQMTFSTPEELNPPLKLAWKYTFEKVDISKMRHDVLHGFGIYVYRNWASRGAVFSPIVVGNLLVIGANDGRVIALNYRTGKTAWTYQTGWMVGTVCANKYRVFAFSGDGNIYALRLTDGKLLWKKSVGPYFLITLSNEVIYGGNGNRVIALRADDGSLIWKQSNWKGLELGIPTPSSEKDVEDSGYGAHAFPLVYRDRLYIGTAGKTVYARRLSDGKPVLLEEKGKKRPLFAGDNSQYAVFGNKFYGMTEDSDGQQLAAYDLNLRPLWRKSFPYCHSTFAVSGDGCVYGGMGVILDGKTGKELKSNRSEFHDSNNITLTRDGIWTWDLSADMSFFDKKSLELLWWYSGHNEKNIGKVAPGEGSMWPPVISHGMLYLLSDDGSLYAFRETKPGKESGMWTRAGVKWLKTNKKWLLPLPSKNLFPNAWGDPASWDK